MIDKDGSLRCGKCDKEILLSLEMVEGKVKFYCPRCHHYQEIKASTVEISKLDLTKQIFGANLLAKK